MRLGIGSWTFPWHAKQLTAHSPYEFVQWIVRYAISKKISVIQLCDNVDLRALSEAEESEFIKELSTRNIELQIGTAGIDRKNLNEALRLAEKYSCRLIRILTDTEQSKPCPLEIINAFIGIKERIEACNIVFAIENHDRYNSAQLLDIIENINSQNVGICLDTANSFGQEENYDTVYRVLKKHIKNIHFKDYDIVRVENKMGFKILGAEAGKGRLNIQKMIDEINREFSNMDIIIEQWPPTLKDITASMSCEMEWADTAIQLLKNV